MATFRTGPDGRAVISDDNRVTVQAGDIDRGGFTPRERAAGINRIGANPGSARTINRFEGDRRSGGFGPPVLQDQGTGYMTRQEFENVAGITDTNPYGNDGYFTREHGIDPRKIDYTGILGLRGMENVKRQAYDRFLRPFAQVDAFGRPTMGANAALGITRSGVQPDDLTIYGPAVQSQREGLAGLFENTMLGSLMPKQARIPGYDRNFLLPKIMAGPAVGGGTEPPGIPYFTSSTNPPLAADAPSMEEVKAARDAGERSFGETDFETERRATDEDSPFFRGTVREIVPREIFTDDITVADVLAAEPMVTTPKGRIPGYVDPVIDPDTGMVVEGGTILPTGPEVVQAIPAGDPGSASITAVGRGPGAVSSDILSPENIAEILELPGRDPDAPAPFDMIDALSPSLPPAPPAQPRGGRDIILVMPDGRVIDSRNAGQ